MVFLLSIGVAWIFFAALVGALAVAFERSGAIFFLASLVVSPLLALVLLVVIGKGKPSKGTGSGSTGAQIQDRSASLNGIGILFSTALVILCILLGATLAIKVPSVPKAGGFFGGLLTGGMLAYGTTWIFPDQMMN